MNLTPEKKIALNRVLTSQGAVVETSINSLQEVNEYLMDNLTSDNVHIKAALNRAINNLRYENEVITSFKKELSK